METERSMPIDAAALHSESIVIDAVCPLLQKREYVNWYKEGGVTVAAPTLATTEGMAAAFKAIANWKAFLRSRPDLMQIRAAGDIETAKRHGKLGLLFHFQGCDPLEDDADLVHVYKELGVGIMQLCYNVKNRLGDGADERTDAGASYFGIRTIRAMNAARVIVDCAHTGVRTSLDAVEASTHPVVVSHGNARAIHHSVRNLPDHLIKAVGQSDGLVGIVGFPGFVGPGTKPTLDQFIDHLAYIADLIGIDHVGLGIDYYVAQWPVVTDEEAKRVYDKFVADGVWRSNTYGPPPHYYPAGIETPRTLPALTARLLERGFDADATRKVLGLNWLRVYRAVWGE
jgi:membrane dipeptidase